MRDEILTYLEMCTREGLSLQRGMNFRPSPGISIFLMSRRPSAPYEDEISGDGRRLIYEGHDVQRVRGVDPKTVDQPWSESGGRPSDNAKFARASEAGDQPPLVRVYEKLRQGIWSDKGVFALSGYIYERKLSENRRVFKFLMDLTDVEDVPVPTTESPDHVRMIPTAVKQEVYKRDRGQCVLCGAKDQLHFDHDFPFSKGGSSFTPENVRILCARHNLSKGARIE